MTAQLIIHSLACFAVGGLATFALLYFSFKK